MESKVKRTSYEWEGRTFARAAHDTGGVRRGTVLTEGRVIHGYPRIMRVLHLGRGIDRHMKGGFYVEEKMDGYNVRLCLVDGKPLAFTRGGFVCPFTTERISDLMDASFFSRHPGLILCGEVVGPESPYNTEVIPYLKEDVKFYAFDIMNNSGVPPAIEEKYSIFDGEGVPQVRRWGPFTAKDINAIKDIILSLDGDGREGIVIKGTVPPAVKKAWQIKYVTLSSCLRDIEATAPIMAELPAGYYIQRIMRAVFFCHEFGVSFSDDYLLRAAKALYAENLKLLDDIEKGGDVRESFNVKVREKDTAEALVGRLRQTEVKISLTSIEKTDGFYRAAFHRVYRKGTKEMRRMLSGHGFYD